MQLSVFCLSGWLRKHWWLLLHPGGVTRRGRSAICSPDLRVRGGSALPQICSHSYHPLPGWEHIAAGGPGGQGGEASPSACCKTQLVLAARSHTPSSAINHVARISLISYRGEPEEASAPPAKKIWTRRRFVWPQGSSAEASLLFQRHFHFYSSSFRLPSAQGSEVLLWKFVVFLMSEQTSLNGWCCRSSLGQCFSVAGAVKSQIFLLFCL